MDHEPANQAPRDKDGDVIMIDSLPQSPGGAPSQEPESLKFGREDLIYGLADPRGKFVLWLKKNGRINEGEPIFIDQYDIASGDRNTAVVLRHDRRFIDALRRRYSDVVTSADNGLDLSDGSAWRGDEFLPTCRIAKRKCKGGLEWLMFGPHGASDARRVHFVVDGLDEHVPAKNYSDPKRNEFKNENQKFRTITGAELRWVFRNRESERVSKNILFWRESRSGWETCDPPWSDTRSSKTIRDAWSAYKGQTMHGLSDRFSHMSISPRPLGSANPPSGPIRQLWPGDRMDVD